nr:MAG TPA: tail tape measure protein [Bacteriophage sp.]
MADELGFEIASDVSQALGEIYKMSGSLNNLSRVWNDTVNSVGQNNIADAIRNQSEKSREALSDMGIPDVEAKFLKLQDAVNKATTGFQEQAGRVVLLKKEISDLEDRLSGIAIKEGTDSEAYERTSISIARKQLALNKAEQAVNSYAVRMTTAKKALSDYAIGIREATAAAEEQAKSRQIDTSKAFTDAPKTLFKGKFAGLAEEFGAYKAETSSLYNTADAEEEVSENAEKASSSVKKLGDSMKGTKKPIRENNTFLAQLTRSIKNILFYRLVRGVIKSITIAARESANAMAIWSEQFDTGATGAAASFNDNISAIASNLLFVRNAIMAAAEPIISALTPAFNMLASAIASAFNMLSHFLSALTGRSFYNKAIKNNVNYANSLKAGSKAQKAFLAGFDELEVVQSSQGGGAGSTLGVDPSAMWERAEVEDSMKNLTEPFRNAMDNLRSIFDKHAEGLKSAVSNLFSSVLNWASKVDTSFWDDFFGEGRIGALLFNDALTLLENTMNDLSIVIDNVIAPFSSGFIKGFSDAAGVIYKFLKDVLSPIYDKLREVFGFIDEHGDTISKISEKIGYVTGVIAAAITAIIAAKTAISAVAVVIGALTSPVGLTIAAISALIAIFVKLYAENEEFRNFVDGIIKLAQEIIPGIIQGIQNSWSRFKEWWSQLWKNPIQWFKNIFGIHSPSTVFAGFGVNIVQGLINGINSLMQRVFSVTSRIRSALNLSSLAASARGWGSDFVNGLVGGINGLIGTAAQAAANVARSVRRILHFSRPDEGPLRDYETWMPDFMKGLAKGIDDNSNLVYDSVNELSAGMKSAMSVPTLGIGGVSGQFGNDLGSYTQAQINANASLADVFWQGCMAVVQAINDNQLEVSIGDDVIGRAATRYNRKQDVINGGAY